MPLWINFGSSECSELVNHPLNMKPKQLLMVAIITLLASNAFAAGVVVFKEQAFHADATATPIAYKNFASFGEGVWCAVIRHNLSTT